MDNTEKTEEEWKKELTPEQYRVLREKGTEQPFTGKFDNYFEKGKYTCAACDSPIFSSNDKYDAKCGWPSFDQAIPGSVEFHDDTSIGMHRVEVTCAHCGGHLGHVFPDLSRRQDKAGGPQDTTGQRFCINSISLGFEKEKEQK
ncbi:peptide-methionine (R)-S-oxide reductase [Candidatus Wolfebacteria bacterium]|nr:MAG: peptide-methionine (R)-S-oxide reductase [Candidatus Wolfebacteria bacterium]